MEKSTRVRYKLVNGVYTSTQSFLGHGGFLLSVSITTNPSQPGCTIDILSEGQSVASQVDVPSLAKAKVLAKIMLKSLGVNFLDEVRNRSTEQVEQHE